MWPTTFDCWCSNYSIINKTWPAKKGTAKGTEVNQDTMSLIEFKESI